MHDGVALSLAHSTEWTPITRVSDTQHGFYAGAFGTPWLFGNGPWPWYNSGSSDIVRFVQGGVAKTFRWQTQSMHVIAMYWPRLTSLSVWFGLALIIVAALVLFRFCRPRFGTRFSALALLLGWALSISHGVATAITDDLGDYGDLCRDWNSTSLPDWCFSLFMFFDTGYGSILSLLGLLAAVVVTAVSQRVFGLPKPRPASSA